MHAHDPAVVGQESDSPTPGQIEHPNDVLSVEQGQPAPFRAEREIDRVAADRQRPAFLAGHEIPASDANAGSGVAVDHGHEAARDR